MVRQRGRVRGRGGEEEGAGRGLRILLALSIQCKNLSKQKWLLTILSLQYKTICLHIFIIRHPKCQVSSLAPNRQVFCFYHLRIFYLKDKRYIKQKGFVEHNILDSTELIFFPHDGMYIFFRCHGPWFSRKKMKKFWGQLLLNQWKLKR